MVLLASEEAVKEYDLPTLATITDTQWAGLDPAVMGMGPVHSMSPIMQRNNFSIADIDFWEINEAFATQVLGNIEAWKDDDYCQTNLELDKAMGEIPHDKLNIDGGGVSLGHPVGASGARIVLHLRRENSGAVREKRMRRTGCTAKTLLSRDYHEMADAQEEAVRGAEAPLPPGCVQQEEDRSAESGGSSQPPSAPAPLSLPNNEEVPLMSRGPRVVVGHSYT